MRFFTGFLSRPDPHRPSGDQYRPFTIEFDRQVGVRDLDAVLGRLSPGEARGLAEATNALRIAMESWRASATIHALEASARLRAAQKSDFSDTFVSLLVDHSGSMKGQRIMLAAASCEIAQDMLFHLGCGFEVLGFTTVSWHGGESRKLWKRKGKPNSPGRLCDLLHVVHRDENRTIYPSDTTSLSGMLRPGLLKENVDGEALLWAAGRQRRRSHSKKIIIVLSDGAPVDDSTLMENGVAYLETHLRQTIRNIIEAQDIRLHAIGLGYDVSRYYPNAKTIQDPSDLSSVLIDTLEFALS